MGKIRSRESREKKFESDGVFNFVSLGLFTVVFFCFKLADFSGFHPPMKIYAELRE